MVDVTGGEGGGGEAVAVAVAVLVAVEVAVTVEVDVEDGLGGGFPPSFFLVGAEVGFPGVVVAGVLGGGVLVVGMSAEGEAEGAGEGVALGWNTTKGTKEKV